MKKAFLLLIPILLTTGCSDNTYSPTEAGQNGSGKISLNIDKENKPSNVIEVNAYLTRDGFDTLSASLNLITDSTAELTITNIAAGNWHLKVDALDSANVIVYSGETDITVLADLTTQINLNLLPTGNGFGSILIHVSWGQSQDTKWKDYPGNPILSLQNNYWDYGGVWQCRILYDNGIYKMWYMGLAVGGVGHIGYAESTNAISWTRPYSEPVLSPGNYGEWDATNVTPGAIIKENGIYKMYYGGWANQYGQWSVGLATSTDGIHWNKYSNNPVLKGTSGWEYQISPSSVIQIDSIYYMYYTARNFPNYSIGLATSSDGINWTRYSGNPILSPTNSWESTGVYNPSVIPENGIFKMVYSNASPNTALGMALSIDGIHWNKYENNPIFEKQNTSNNWGVGGIGFPFLIKINNEYRIYYSGRLPDSDIYRIGYIYRNVN